MTAASGGGRAAAVTLVVVTGPAGSGKTTLAHALAAEIGCPALCRDEVKEGMVASRSGFVAGPGDPLTLRTYDAFFELIGVFLRYEVTLVAEAAFQHGLWSRGLAPMSGWASLKVVRCHVDEAVARQRMLDRMAERRRTAHADADHLAAAAPFEAVRLDVPTLDVDTTDGWRPGLAPIASFVRA